MMLLYIIGGLLLLSLIRYFVWERPNEITKKYKEELDSQRTLHEKELEHYKDNIEKLQKLHLEEISKLQARLENSNSLHIQEAEFSDIVISYAWQEIHAFCNVEFNLFEPEKTSSSFLKRYSPYIPKKDYLANVIKQRFLDAIDEQYKYRYLVFLFPELAEIFDGANIKTSFFELPDSIGLRSKRTIDVVKLLEEDPQKTEELFYWKNRVSFLEASKSNLTAIPYMAAIMADYETYGIEHLAKELDWGHAVKRMDKVKTIREIRKDALAIVEKNKESQYQLAYLLALFPNLKDVIEAEFKQLPIIEVSELADHDSVRDYLSKEEYESLSVTERNQLALDRYKNSHTRTKWQIGRDYELYVGYKYRQKGYSVDYFGSYMGLEDLGRDLIAKKDGETLIIQCKYWSEKKQIHENHVNQLYGTMVSYCIEHQADKTKVKGILVTNIELSSMAKKMASYLGIEYIENYERGDYPCIKCNIGHGENGEVTKIYHLPFDQQYDSTKIQNEGEFFAVSVAEAEAAGFRRAFKWFGSN